MLYRIESSSTGIHESLRRADYTHMRCLYCGKELALLKRLTGGGEFCSDAHKQSYQEEYNRLALSRLLQAQKKGHQTGNSPGQAPPAPAAAVAVEELTPEPRVPERVRQAEIAQAAAVTPGAPVELPAAEDIPSNDTETSRSAEPAEPDATEPAGFLLDNPGLAGVEEQPPYQEAWLEIAAGPAMSEWQAEKSSAFELSQASLQALNFGLSATRMEDGTVSLDLSAEVWPSVTPGPALAASANGTRRVSANQLPSRGAMAIEIAPSTAATSVDHNLAGGLDFATTAEFGGSRLSELPPAAIDFPSEDSDVAVVARGEDPGSAVAGDLIGEDTDPRSSLEALSRLHQEMIQQETIEATPRETVEATPLDPVTSAPDQVIQPPEGLSEVPQEPAVQEPEPPSKPPYSTELFDISIRTFPASKAALIGGNAHPAPAAPLLPHLKSLPLRPKVAVATGYAPPSTVKAPEKPPLGAETPARPQGPSKPPQAAKPAARLAATKPPHAAAKPAQPPTAKAVSAAADVAKPVPQPAPAQPVSKPDTARVASREPAAKTEIPAEKAPSPKAAPVVGEPAADPVKPNEQARPNPDYAKPNADQAKPALARANPDQVKTENVPNFGVAQPGNVPWFASLKLKLGIAIVLLTIACVYFLGWGRGKPRVAANSNAVSSDGSGPSIILGEGGWVEGWGGDPSGVHAGRQITIYRPSLKLSDYRLEFQASIDVKSVGWVFRAADPDNYYAMKIMTVSAVPLKVALFKYMVSNGKQTQVGRVPIDLPVEPDTIFNVRVDIRGPRFTTYIQGHQVDSWTDDQLKAGGAGFLNEREERGNVKSVSIRYLTGAAK